jgi:hypothetical protein
LRDEEIGYAYQFGNENTVRNILEPNWWQSDEQTHQNQMVANEVLRLNEERRRREEEDGVAEEDYEMAGGDPVNKDKVKEKKVNVDGDEKPKVVAKTRVRWHVVSICAVLIHAATLHRGGSGAIQVYGNGTSSVISQNLAWSS